MFLLKIFFFFFTASVTPPSKIGPIFCVTAISFHSFLNITSNIATQNIVFYLLIQRNIVSIFDIKLLQGGKFKLKLKGTYYKNSLFQCLCISI